MLKENIIEENLDGVYYHHKRLIHNSKNKAIPDKEIFKKIIDLMYKKNSYMLGPEKSKTARFIAQNSIDVYKIISEKLKSLE